MENISKLKKSKLRTTLKSKLKSKLKKYKYLRNKIKMKIKSKIPTKILKNVEKYISPCMLFTGSLFIIPTFLSFFNNFFLESVVTFFVTVSSLFYHSHYLNKNGNPNEYFRFIDMFISLSACFIFYVKGYNLTIPMIFGIFVPILYLLSWLYFFLSIQKNIHFFGCGGLHSLMHIFGIFAYSSLIFFRVVNIDLVNTAIIGACGLFISICLFIFFYINKELCDVENCIANYKESFSVNPLFIGGSVLTLSDKIS